MSLINDALKRAKEAQNKTEQTPPPDLKLREVDAKEQASSRPTWLVPSLITAAVVASIFVVWEFKRGSSDTTQKSSAASEQNSPEGKSGSSLKVHAREQDVAVLPHGLGAVDTGKVGVVAVSPTTIQETTGQGTNSNLPADGLPPKPSGPRLQGIIYNPASPSATISGNLVFVGEKVGEWRVAAIGRDSATLVNKSQTNVLKLGE